MDKFDVKVLIKTWLNFDFSGLALAINILRSWECPPKNSFKKRINTIYFTAFDLLPFNKLGF